jgi:hypothetical protein
MQKDKLSNQYRPLIETVFTNYAILTSLSGQTTSYSTGEPSYELYQ